MSGGATLCYVTDVLEDNVLCGVGGRGRWRPRPNCLISDEFQSFVKPALRFMFALPAAERSSVTCPACVQQVLRMAPEANRCGSGCVILVWLHGFSIGLSQ